MKSILLRSHVDLDGILRLQIPIGLTNTDVDIALVVQPLSTAESKPVERSSGWQPGFFEEGIGSWAGEPLVRERQGKYEIREELRNFPCKSIAFGQIQQGRDL